MNKIKSFFQHPEFTFWGAVILWVMLILMFIAFVGVIFIESISTAVSRQLDIKNKAETLKFIGLGMSGVLATIGAIAINRRATAQIKNAEAQVDNNRLTEKGHIDERFKSATEHLGSERPMTRISAFYQFYYLAKDRQDNNFRKSIFDILCAYLRSMTQEKSYQEGNREQIALEECQTLLNILFKSSDKSVFDGFVANLYKVNLKNTDLSDANLSGANLMNANLSGVNFARANLSEANLDHANLIEAQIDNANLNHANLNHVSLTNAHIYETDLSSASLREADLEDATIADVNLNCANLICAKINNARIGSTNLSHANLSGAECLNAIFSNTNLSNADLTGAKLQHAYLSNANLSNADLTFAYLPSANLSGAKLVKANLSGAQLSGELFLKENPSPPDARIACIIRCANLKGADLSGANLSGAELSGINRIPSDLNSDMPSDLNVELKNVHCIEGTDFRKTNVNWGQLPTDKGKYIATWTTDEFWEEVEKNEES